jgi:hypothetical protein
MNVKDQTGVAMETFVNMRQWKKRGEQAGMGWLGDVGWKRRDEDATSITHVVKGSKFSADRGAKK